MLDKGWFVGKRTGFVLATIHQGSSLSMWKTIASEAEKRPNDVLFVFPGGRIDNSVSNEFLRNEIYSLVNGSNLDTAIVWSSSITGEKGIDATVELVEKIISSGIPVVSLGYTIDGIPSVDFNAYSGVFSEVCHLIRVHGARKIAFLRGPNSHPSAPVRFQAYKDALQRNGIVFNPLLVSSPSDWVDGGKAIRELVEGRGLVPGIDFDSLVSPSDMMLLWAVKYLESKGVSIPREVRVAGFNDTVENSLNSVETTTVKMPIRALATTAYTLSQEIVEYPEDLHASIILPTELILRKSCGCSNSFGGFENASKTISDWDSLSKWLQNRIDNEAGVKTLIELLEKLYIHGWFMKQEGPYPISRLLDKYFSNGGKADLLFESMDLAEKVFKAEPLALDARELIHYLAIHFTNRSNNLVNFEDRMQREVMDKFKMELLAISSIEDLIDRLQHSLPSLGIRKAFLILKKDEETSTFAGGFECNIKLDKGVDFPSNLIIDPEHSISLESGVYIIEPLIYNNNYIGYLIISANSRHDGIVLEDIRNVISASLKGIELFKVASQKSYAAEAAEIQSQEFYAKLSEGLRGPLGDIQRMADEDLNVHREDIRNSATAALHMLELALAERGDLNLSKHLVPGSEIIGLIRHSDRLDIEAPDLMPALEIDKETFSKIFTALIDLIYPRESESAPKIKISLKATSVEFALTGGWDQSLLEQNSTLLYAEKLVLMHSGSFAFSTESIILNFPYPSLSGVLSIPANSGKVVYIRGGETQIPRLSSGTEIMEITESDLVLQGFKFPSEAVSIMWDVSVEYYSSRIVLNLLRNHVDTKSLPFICFGIKKEAPSLFAALEGTVDKSDKSIIYSIGAFPSSFNKLREFATVIELSTYADAEDVENEGALVFVYDLPLEGVVKLRNSLKFSRTPIIVIKDQFSLEDAEMLSDVPNVLFANTCILESDDFNARVLGIFGGGELLPPLTSALVKKAIVYLNKNASSQISRWQLAAAVNISEDYLTRIFRRETGISPWDYLNRYRIQMASRLLTQTGLSINEIAKETGFQDQAYFCRVFKKVKGFPPGKVRQRF